MAVTTFTLPFFGTPAFFSGTGQTTLVPSLYPVAINGRPYMIDQKSGEFTRGYEPRVRDSQDISTAPGEAAINPGGLWRRGQDSWHLGAGQQYADTAEAQDYRFYKSKGIDPWTKGQISLLNSTARALESTATTQRMLVQDGRVYIAIDEEVKFTTDPFDVKSATVSNVSAAGGTVTYTTSAAHGFTAGRTVSIVGVSPVAYNLTNVTIAATPTTTTFTVTNAATGTFVSGGTAHQYAVWTDCTGEPGSGKKCVALATDGDRIYFGFESDGIRVLDPGTSTTAISNTKFINTTDNYYMLGFAKGFMFGAYDHELRNISNTGSIADIIKPIDAAWRWVGVATGQNAVYAAGYASKKSMVYKVTIKADGTLDKGVVALELPTGEIATSISGYLGFIILGTNKGVRFCSADSNSNLVAGSLIQTSGSVLKSASNDRFSYFTWSNYDGTAGGLGRMDLTTFTSANTPAYATDLMYDSSADVTNVVVFNDKPVFMISGIGVVVEDSSRLVSSGNIELGTYRWGIPDRKFVARVDVRSEPLKGSINAYLSNDEESYEDLGTWSTLGDTENTFTGSDQKTIEAKFKLVLTRSSTVTEGPVVTRWMARAYAAPFRSQTFSVPVLLHNKLKLRNNREVFIDVQEETDTLDELLSNPRIIVLQLGSSTHSVIVEDIRWVPVDSYGNKWEWEGTAVVIMRSVEN